MNRSAGHHQAECGRMYDWYLGGDDNTVRVWNTRVVFDQFDGWRTSDFAFSPHYISLGHRYWRTRRQRARIRRYDRDLVVP
jgi:hypothetical protein